MGNTIDHQQHSKENKKLSPLNNSNNNNNNNNNSSFSSSPSILLGFGKLNDLPISSKQTNENHIIDFSNEPFCRDLKFIACGSNHSILVTKNNLVYAMGDNRTSQCYNANINNNNVNIKSNPITFFRDLNKNIKFVDCNEATSWFILEDNTIYNTGDDCFHQRGKYHLDNNSLYAKVETKFLKNANDEITHFSCGRYHSCLVVNSKKVYGLGYASFGQTGTGQKSDVTDFIKCKFDGKHGMVDKISCGRYFTLLLTKNKEAWATGSCENNQIFSDVEKDIFKKINIFPSICNVFAAHNGYHSFIFSGSENLNTSEIPINQIGAAGWNESGQLGCAKLNNIYGIVKVDGISDLPLDQIEMFPIFRRSFLVSSSKEILSCGSNANGECGIKSCDTITKFTKLTLPYSLINYNVKIIGGDYHTFIFAQVLQTKDMKYFEESLVNSILNSQLCDTTIIVTNEIH
ncbi:hypothetical protein ABK040_006702 [Willaertia magna]